MAFAAGTQNVPAAALVAGSAVQTATLLISMHVADSH
jgi:hypothetical protein